MRYELYIYVYIYIFIKYIKVEFKKKKLSIILLILLFARKNFYYSTTCFYDLDVCINRLFFCVNVFDTLFSTLKVAK